MCAGIMDGVSKSIYRFIASSLRQCAIHKRIQGLRSEEGEVHTSVRGRHPHNGASVLSVWPLKERRAIVWAHSHITTSWGEKWKVTFKGPRHQGKLWKY